MVRKILITTGSLTLLTVLFFGRDAASYVRTSFGWMKSSVNDSVPIEFKIDVARKMVKDLLPDIRKNMHVIAQEEVEIERLEKQIAQVTATVDRERGEIVRLKDDLSSGKSEYRYGSRIYTVSQVKGDLASRFERFKAHEDTLASLRDIQSARRKSLEAARAKLDGMLVARKKLEVDVENLEARFKMVEVAQTTSEYNIDDSQLARVKDVLAEIRSRLSVAERLATSEGNLDGEIQLSAPEVDDIVDQITEYFGRGIPAPQVAEAQAVLAQ